MKIDLHLHTIKTSCDSTNRNIINPENFLEQLKCANVGICAITNHNTFDLEQYNNLNNINTSEILILPGVELDVFGEKKDKRMQLNLIVNPRIETLNKLVNFLSRNKITHEKPIDIQLLIDEFGLLENDAIFYLDAKGNQRFDENTVEKFFKENEYFKGAYAFDANNQKTFQLFLSQKENCLIGSDNMDWDDYPKKYGSKLIEYHSIINTFDILFDIFKNGETFMVFERYKLNHVIHELIMEGQDPKTKKDVEICRISNFNIIKNGVNVIFGPKSTGKTLLLNSIFKNLSFVPPEKKKIYLANKEIDSNEVLKNICDNSSKEFHDTIIEFQEKLKWIKKYSENEINKHTLKDFRDFMERGNEYSIKIFDIPLDSMPKDAKSGHLIEAIKEIKKAIDDLEKYATLTGWNIAEDIGIMWAMCIKIRSEYIKMNKEYWKNCFLKKTTKCISTIYKKYKTNVNWKCSSFGLFDFYKSRKQLFNEISSLKILCNNDELKDYKVSEINIPIENDEKSFNTWEIHKKLIFSFDKRRNKKFSGDIKDYADSLKNIINSKKFCNLLTDILIINKHNFIDEIYYIETCFESKDKKMGNKLPSPGELAYINLKTILENDTIDYYFLDEPESRLNNKFISIYILPLIMEIIKNKKTIILATHNSVFGINTKPINYILRESKVLQVGDMNYYETWYGNLAEKNMFSFFEENKKIDIREKILEYFEGTKELYEFRRNVYGDK